MSWGAGQKRLKTLFGAQDSLCLQVFCEFYQGNGVSSERFDELVEKHGFTSKDLSGVRYLPRPQIGEIEFRPGHIFIDQDGVPGGSEAFVQAVFTSMDRELIRQVQQSYDGDDYVCFSNPVLDNIMAQYVPVIEQKLPQLDFEGKRYADIGSISVEFKFGIQPYSFNLHPPRDMDVLKPITIIDGHIISPLMNRANNALLSEAQEPKLQ
jgi:hypothetical protein